MKDLSWAPGGFFVTTNNNGSQSFQPVAIAHITRWSTGYSGVKVRQSPMPIHPYSFMVQEVTGYRTSSTMSKVGDSWITSGGRGPFLFPSVQPISFYPAPNYDNVYNNALAKLGDKVRGSLDLSIDLAEAGKTVKMLNLAKGVRGIAETVFKRGTTPVYVKRPTHSKFRFGNKVKEVRVDKTVNIVRQFGPEKAMADLWLAKQYGWKPLLQSIYGLAEENIRVVLNKLERYSARATEPYAPPFADIPAYWGYYQLPLKHLSNLRVSCTIGCYLDNPTVENDLRRFTSLNPMSIAWELLPYSFVVDWFYNVGGYLRSVENAFLYHNRWRSGYVTKLLAGNITFEKNNSSFSPTSQTVDHTAVDIRIIKWDRQVLGTFPFPHTPSLRADLGSSRLLSAASLLAKLVSRR